MSPPLVGTGVIGGSGPDSLVRLMFARMVFFFVQSYFDLFSFFLSARPLRLILMGDVELQISRASFSTIVATGWMRLQGMVFPSVFRRRPPNASHGVSGVAACDAHAVVEIIWLVHYQMLWPLALENSDSSALFDSKMRPFTAL